MNVQIPSALRILMYHSIAHNPRDPHAVTPEAFEAQMYALAASGVRVVPLMEGIRAVRRLVSPQPMTAITFDDGYRDFLTHAAPILKRYSLPALLFIPTGLVGKTAQWDSYDRSKPLLDWDELREVERQGFDIASHSVSHPRLVDCDEVMLEYEYRDSMAELAIHLERVTPVFAYPAGYAGMREVTMARKTGYLAAVGVTSRMLNHPWTNPYRLRRQKWETPQLSLF